MKIGVNFSKKFLKWGQNFVSIFHLLLKIIIVTVDLRQHIGHKGYNSSIQSNLQFAQFACLTSVKQPFPFQTEEIFSIGGFVFE